MGGCAAESRLYLFAVSLSEGLQQYKKKGKSVELQQGTAGPAAPQASLCVIHGTGAARGGPGGVKDEHSSQTPDAAPMMLLTPREHYPAPNLPPPNPPPTTTRLSKQPLPEVMLQANLGSI